MELATLTARSLSSSFTTWILFGCEMNATSGQYPHGHTSPLLWRNKVTPEAQVLVLCSGSLLRNTGSADGHLRAGIGPRKELTRIHHLDAPPILPIHDHVLLTNRFHVANAVRTKPARHKQHTRESKCRTQEPTHRRFHHPAASTCAPHLGIHTEPCQSNLSRIELRPHHSARIVR